MADAPAPPRGPAIQVIPPGLLGFLQLKQQNAPSFLPDLLSCTLEMRDWYFKARELIDVGLYGGAATVALATATPGMFQFTTNPITVPNQQWWYVDNFTIHAALLAAETLVAAPCMFYDPTTLVSRFKLGDTQGDAITARGRQWACQSKAPFWAPPGAQLGIWVYDVLTAATITAIGHIRATVLPI